MEIPRASEIFFRELIEGAADAPFNLADEAGRHPNLLGEFLQGDAAMFSQFPDFQPIDFMSRRFNGGLNTILFHLHFK